MYFLIAFIFISKISLHFVPGIPYESSNIIFQYGFHPYVNILLCLMFGGFLIFKRLLKIKTEAAQQLRFYSFYIFLFCVFLFTITCLQVLFIDSTESATMQIAASLLSIFMIYLFGKYIPTQMSPHSFILMVQNYGSFLCWISLILLFISPATSFLGGRFIGVFKHIPHMVSVATLAYIFGLYILFCREQTKVQRFYLYACQLAAVACLILTGTRSALASIAMATILSFILFSLKKARNQFLKVALIFLVITTGLFFGNDMTDYVVQVSRGEKSVGLRAAQDGVTSRWDEVLRGYEIFQQQPWLGHGILSKFGQNDDGAVGAYDASKDPHNVFVSAGVVGGWGLIIIVFVGYISLLILTLLKLKSKNDAIKLLAIYMITQLPIIFIYHVHISMGGIADRIYWLVIGYLAISYFSVNNQSKT